MTGFWANPFVHDGIGFICGIIASAIFYFLAIKRKAKPRWRIVSESPVLIDNGDVNKYLQISYKGNQLGSLSVTNILLGNIGRLALRGTDVEKPIRIYMKNDIIDVLVTETSNDSIVAKIFKNDKNDNYVEIFFTNLYDNDYVNLSLIHSGAKVEDLKVEAKFIDTELKQFTKVNKFIQMAIPTLVGMLSGVVPLFLFDLNIIQIFKEMSIRGWISFTLATIIMVMGMYIYSIKSKIHRNKRRRT